MKWWQTDGIVLSHTNLGFESKMLRTTKLDTGTKTKPKSGELPRMSELHKKVLMRRGAR